MLRHVYFPHGLKRSPAYVQRDCCMVNTLLFQSGQNSAFSLPFSKIGLFYNAIRNVVGTMGQRVAASGGSDPAEGLADAVTVKAVASGRDADSGDKLLWIETADGGPFAFRLNPETIEMLADVLREEEDSPAYQPA
jgi:hypothetical protein